MELLAVIVTVIFFLLLLAALFGPRLEERGNNE